MSLFREGSLTVIYSRCKFTLRWSGIRTCILCRYGCFLVFRLPRIIGGVSVACLCVRLVHSPLLPSRAFFLLYFFEVCWGFLEINYILFSLVHRALTSCQVQGCSYLKHRATRLTSSVAHSGTGSRASAEAGLGCLSLGALSASVPAPSSHGGSCVILLLSRAPYYLAGFSH